MKCGQNNEKVFARAGGGEEPAAIKSSSSCRISFVSGAVVPERAGEQTLEAFAIADSQPADSQIVPSPGHRPGCGGHGAALGAPLRALSSLGSFAFSFAEQNQE